MGNWNLQPVALLHFEHPTNRWAMNATLYRSGLLEVLAEESHVPMDSESDVQDDGDYGEAVEFATQMTRETVAGIDAATALVEEYGIDVDALGGWRTP